MINRVINAVTANHARMDVLDEQVRGLALGLDQLELMVAGPTGGGVAEGLEGDDGVAADAQP